MSLHFGLKEAGSLTKRPIPAENLENNNGSSNKKVNATAAKSQSSTKESSNGNKMKASEAFYKECEAKAREIYEEYKVPSNALHDKEKSRNSFRAAFAIQLLAGVEEQLRAFSKDKQKGFVTDKMKKILSMSKGERFRLCVNIAMNIESHIYFNFSNHPDSLSQAYKSKAQQIKHFLSLESNSDLRSAILHEVYRPEKVAVMKEKVSLKKFAFDNFFLENSMSFSFLFDFSSL